MLALYYRHPWTCNKPNINTRHPNKVPHKRDHSSLEDNLLIHYRHKKDISVKGNWTIQEIFSIPLSLSHLKQLHEVILSVLEGYITNVKTLNILSRDISSSSVPINNGRSTVILGGVSTRGSRVLQKGLIGWMGLAGYREGVVYTRRGIRRVRIRW